MSDPANVFELCQQIEERRREKLSRDLGPFPKNNPTASDIGDCVRETVYQITNWRDRPAFDLEVRARLDRGTKIEDMVIQELRDLGYSIRQDRIPFELRDKKNRLICRGKVDGYLSLGRKEYPFEVKSLHPNVYARIERQDDFDRYHFFKKYPRQLQIYMYANNFEEGFWLLDDCLGHKKLIPCKLDYERVEKILQHLELAVEHLAQGSLPEYHSDPAYCLRCSFYGRLCSPPFFATSEGLRQVEDPEVAEKLDRWGTLHGPHGEYERLDKDIKDLFKGKTNMIVGDWLVRGEEKIRKEKAREARESKYWRLTIESLKEQNEEGE